MAENEAPISSAQPDPFPFLDRAGYASYSHVDLLGIRFNVNQQIGSPVLLAAVAALVGVVKLAALISRFHEAKEASSPSVTCWGSGTPLREFLHADDLGEACVHALEH